MICGITPSALPHVQANLIMVTATYIKRHAEVADRIFEIIKQCWIVMDQVAVEEEEVNSFLHFFPIYPADQVCVKLLKICVRPSIMSVGSDNEPHGNSCGNIVFCSF